VPEVSDALRFTMVMRHGYRRLVLLRASFRGHLDAVVGALVAFGVAAALSACGGSGSTVSQGPVFPNGRWPAAEAHSFFGACESGASDFYCACALTDEMRRHPDPPGASAAAGIAAAEHKHDFPACAGR